MMRTSFSLHLQKKESFLQHLKRVTIPTVTCALFLLLVLIALALNPVSTIYQTAIESQPNAFTMGVPQTKLATTSVLNYLWFGAPMQLELSTQAVQHMADVRTLFVLGQILIVFLGVCVFFALKNKSKLQRLRLWIWSSASALATLVILLLLSVIGFEKLFLLFHKILFTNDLWLFPANDTLILFFPEYFFYAIATQLLAWLFASIGVLLLFLILKERQQRLSSSKPAQHI